MPHGDPWPFGSHIARPDLIGAVAPTFSVKCLYCGRYDCTSPGGPTCVSGTPERMLAVHVAVATRLLEASGYEVRRKDDPPADEPWRFEPES